MMDDERTVKVKAVMTAPRYTATWPMNVINKALLAHRISLTVSGGVFYGQCMERMFENLLDEVDILLTCDSDSVFTARDVQRLISVAAFSDEIDALAALQARRGMAYPLLSKAGHEGVELAWKPFQVDTAHFGLTAIKTAALRGLPKPWFRSIPDAEGSWGDGRQDDDIHFWRLWTSNGRSVYVDGGTRIGHVEEMVSFYDEDGKHQLTYPRDWSYAHNNTTRQEEGLAPSR